MSERYYNSLILFAILSVCTGLLPGSAFAWDLVLEDSWRDKWELNKIHEDHYKVCYEGQWTFQASRNKWETGKAAATVLKLGGNEFHGFTDSPGETIDGVWHSLPRSGILTLASFYNDGDTAYHTYYPYSAWYDHTKIYRWYGYKHWVRDTQYRDNMWMDIKEGKILGLETISFHKTSIRKGKSANGVVASPIAEATGTLRIGALLPLTGDLASYGKTQEAVLNLALEDLQKALAAAGSTQDVELLIEDTQTSPTVAAGKLQVLQQQGVSVILGPEDSASADLAVMVAADTEQLLLSSSSTAVDLAQSGDNLMRFVQDDTHQAKALLDRLHEDGITHLLIVSRPDVYARGLSESLAEQFEATGGTVPYSSQFTAREFDAVIQSLDEALGQQIAEVGAEHVAVAIVLFEDGIELMRRGSEYENLDSVRWYGTDALAGNADIIEDPNAAAFAAQTGFTCTTIAAHENETYTRIEAEIMRRLGHHPTPLSLSIYDAFTLSATALLGKDIPDIEKAKSVIRIGAVTYSGATSPFAFNANDDRASGEYDYWQVRSNQGAAEWFNESGWEWTDPVPISNWREYTVEMGSALQSPQP